ncbi:MAG: T9SS type A sorting domain-containing protein [Bacteroidota bacterium]
MKKIKLILCISLLITAVNAQNLVLNPSFEEYSNCPDDWSQVQYATGWESYCLTPDYFNNCSSNPIFSVPSNLSGSYQLASSGNAYCGFNAYWSSFGTQGLKNIRDFIGSQLITPLIIGTKYYVSFKVSPGYNNGGNPGCACNNIGIKFTTFSYNNYGIDSVTSPAVNNFAHISSPIIICDTTSWSTVSGSFIADSSYKYIMIGNFFDDNHADTLIFNSSNFVCYAYYYLDDIYVSKDSVENIEDYSFKNRLLVYPNPFNISTTIFVEEPNDYINEIAIYDILGIKKYINILNSNYSNNIKIQIERGTLSQGTYILKIKFKNKIYTKKLFITN